MEVEWKWNEPEPEAAAHPRGIWKGFRNLIAWFTKPVKELQRRFIPNFFRSKEEVATLEYDDVLDQIFQWLPQKDLLTCRLMCHQWNYNATRKLRKNIQVSFYFNHAPQFDNWQLLTSKKGDQSFSLEAFVNLLRSPLENFPCQQFHFRDGSLGNPILQDFCNVYGIKVRKLVLFCESTSPEVEVEEIPTESVFLQQIYRLLCHQMQNLQHFTLKHKVKVEWKEGSSSRGLNSPLLQTDPEFHEIHSLVQRTRFRHLNLEKFKYGIGFDASAKILELIINLAPKLQDVQLDSKNYIFLVEPLNRVHLGRKFVAEDHDLHDSCLVNLFKVEKAIEEANKRDLMNIQELKVFFCEIGHLENQVVAHDCILATLKLTNRVLSCGWESITSVEVHPDVPFLDDILWPRLMPSVTKLTLYCYCYKNYQFIPTGLNLQQTFPKLEFVEIGISEGSNMPPNRFPLKYNSTVVSTVKRVELLDHSTDGINFSFESEIREYMAKVFPNAAIDFYELYYKKSDFPFLL